MKHNRKNTWQTGGSMTAPQTFQTRLLLSILRTAVPIIILICIGFFIMLSKSAEQTILKAQITAMEEIQNDFYYMTENTENLSRDMIYNNEIQSLLQAHAQGEQYPVTSAAAYYINSFIANRDFIDCVVLTGSDATLYSTERAFTNLSDFGSIRQKWWFPRLTEESRPFGWYTNVPNGHAFSAEENKTDDPCLMLARSIYSLQDYTTRLGYLMIYLDDDSLQDILHSCQFGTSTNLWLADQEGKILLSHQPDSNRDYSGLLSAMQPQTQSILRFHGKKYVIGARTLPQNGWTLYMATPYREVNTNASVFTTWLLILLCIVLLVLILLSRHTASTISRPIIRLSKIMDAFHGKDSSALPPDLTQNESLYDTRSDEIGQIYRSYRQMAERMDTLIQEIYIKNLEKKDAELALLQSQINPHFLYNTLDSINWMALANDQEEISEMVTALSDTFRLSLTKSSSSFVRLSQEIAYVKSYLVLQKFRYAERLTYDFFVAPDTENLFIPKFILQPLVENGLKHGIDSIDAGGTLSIRVTLTPEDLLIQIQNDGTTIDLAQMQELLEFDPEHMEFLAFKAKGYGVQNIHRRIRILCGLCYGLSYRMEGTCTICEVRLPKRPDDATILDTSAAK